MTRKSNVYLDDEEMKGWLYAWSFIVYIGGLVSGIILVYFLPHAL
jgi:glycopeptide antibiotics resistance protein